MNATPPSEAVLDITGLSIALPEGADRRARRSHGLDLALQSRRDHLPGW